MKQCIKNKPHKWGYKVFTRCSSTGMMHDFEIYQGKGTVTDEHGLGISGDIVIRLTSTLPSQMNFKVYFDNWFSSVALVDFLRTQGIHSVGTVRQDRTGKAPLRDEKIMKKCGRGTMDCVVDEDAKIAVTRWIDNNSICSVSSYAALDPVQSCQRWSGKDQSKIDVPMPHVVQEYNKFMGGVDLADMVIELYRIDHRSSRWYMRIFHWFLDVAIVNGCFLMRRHQKQSGAQAITFLDFRCSVADSLARAGNHPKASKENLVPLRMQISRPVAARPSQGVRLDGVGHRQRLSRSRVAVSFAPRGAHI
jgi:hypothetical protein